MRAKSKKQAEKNHQNNKRNPGKCLQKANFTKEEDLFPKETSVFAFPSLSYIVSLVVCLLFDLVAVQLVLLSDLFCISLYRPRPTFTRSKHIY